MHVIFTGRVGFKNKDGALQFPVFHSKHPCLLLESSSSSSSSAGSGNATAIIHPSAYSVPKASPVVANDVIHKGKLFMVISLGTPAVFNLVTIDTGSTLSWVQCRSCQIQCHTPPPEVGPIFDDGNSSTYQRVSCSSQDCAAVHERLGVLSGCVEQTDTCLYSLRYGSGPLAQYSVGVGTERCPGLEFDVAGELTDGELNEHKHNAIKWNERIFGAALNCHSFSGLEARVQRHADITVLTPAFVETCTACRNVRPGAYEPNY